MYQKWGPFYSKSGQDRLPGKGTNILGSLRLRCGGLGYMTFNWLNVYDVVAKLEQPPESP